MVGTARYISPEAAEGKPVDGRADVYSLALVLYEAVTGTVPFVTDTTMGTLAARIGQPLPHDPMLGPLDDVLARAAAPDVGARLDAAGLAARLGALAAALPTPAPLPLVMPHLEEAAPINGFRAPGVDELASGETAVVVGGMAGAAGAVAGGATNGSGAAGTEVLMPDEAATMVNRAPVGTRAGPGEIFNDDPSGPGREGEAARSRRAAPFVAPFRNRYRRRMAWIIGAVVAAVVIAAALVGVFTSGVLTPSHPVPTLVGLPVAQARADVAKLHLDLKVAAPVKSVTLPAGVVVSQHPAPKTSLKEGSTVTIVPSGGPPNVTVPSLSGMTCAQAVTALQGAHLKASCTPGQYDNTVPSTVIISWASGSTQNPTAAPYGSTITIVPSLGHQPATVPNIPNTYSFGQAAAALQAVGLQATQANQASTSVPAGDVIKTDPGSGAQAPYGSTVTVYVSTGPPMVQVPDITGDTVQQAVTALQNVGLVANGLAGPPTGTVKGTNPPIGSSVPTGSNVELITK
jgi:serine/threonine-protein kinase